LSGIATTGVTTGRRIAFDAPLGLIENTAAAAPMPHRSARPGVGKSKHRPRVKITGLTKTAPRRRP